MDFDTHKQQIKDFLEGLTRAEQVLVVLYYYEKQPISEIAKTLDLSEARVSQMHSLILTRCKSYLREQEQS